MSRQLHPKTGGAGIGAAVGLLIVALLHQAGAHLVTELPGAITGVTGSLGAFLAPDRKDGRGT